MVDLLDHILDGAQYTRGSQHEPSCEVRQDVREDGKWRLREKVWVVTNTERAPGTERFPWAEGKEKVSECPLCVLPGESHAILSPSPEGSPLMFTPAEHLGSESSIFCPRWHSW